MLAGQLHLLTESASIFDQSISRKIDERDSLIVSVYYQWSSSSAMNEAYTSEVIAACLEGNTAKTTSLITNHRELDVKAFVDGVFSVGLNAAKNCYHTFEYGHAWWTMPMFPELDQTVVTSVEMVLREYDGLFDSKAAANMFEYSCCAHINLVPVILELFKDRLGPRCIRYGIEICGSWLSKLDGAGDLVLDRKGYRHPEMRWFIMSEYMDRFTGKTIYECFNLCCCESNLPMLEFWINCHHAELEAYYGENLNHSISIDWGLSVCCKNGDIEVIEFLISRCRFLGSRLLHACVKYYDLEMAELVINGCREIMTIESEGLIKLMLSPLVEKVFNKAIKHNDTDILELIVCELGDSLSIDAKEAAFMMSFDYYNVPFAKMMLGLYASDLMFEDGLEGEPPEAMPTEAMWELLVETYDDRVQRTDTNWLIKPILTESALVL